MLKYIITKDSIVVSGEDISPVTVSSEDYRYNEVVKRLSNKEQNKVLQILDEAAVIELKSLFKY